MNIEEFKSTIDVKLKENPHYLETLGQNATCLSHPMDINNILIERKEQILTREQLDGMWRAWPFRVNLEDGDFYFLAWDIGNGGYIYSCELTNKDIIRVLNQNAS